MTMYARSPSVIASMVEPTVSTSPVAHTNDRKYLRLHPSKEASQAKTRALASTTCAQGVLTTASWRAARYAGKLSAAFRGSERGVQ